MPEVSATEAARRFSDMLDSVEHEKRRINARLRRDTSDEEWSEELRELRGLIEIEDRS